MSHEPCAKVAASRNRTDAAQRCLVRMADVSRGVVTCVSAQGARLFPLVLEGLAPRAHHQPPVAGLRP